ncbi:hypothetical protein [Nocardia sp. alder85J]|uniref:hypothetical protein n=1 Tax=Nocardia sp. alder85J TaxID=2862949 RepID=UPI001CD3680D|nr:hypothetical protein [Nocardia sp. alder85J]MCX4094159.1 hypothetical protein [Nocardia sp. alder85J]
MPAHRQVTYTDELLADGTVHRRYSDGREEWRSRTPVGQVAWQDNQGNSGTDEPLGRNLVKRRYRDGRVVYGREGGYGRTLWGGGMLTVNRSSFGGRVGIILAAVAGGALLTAMAMPPDVLTLEQEEELRRQAVARQSDSGDGSGDSGWGDDSGDDSGDFG